MTIEFRRKFPFVFRVVYPKHEETMPVGEREAFFRVLDQMVRLRPEWLPLKRVSGWSELLFQYDFQSSAFQRYAGMELVFLDRERVAYHRLPGALPDGAGHVPAGQYRFR